MINFGDCEKSNKNPTIVLHDKGSKNTRSKFRLENPNKSNIRLVQVDDCAIKEGLRCDYLVILPDKQELYIELKGRDVEHAVKQIESSIQKLTVDKLAKKFGFISSTRCPINSAQIQILKKKFKDKYNAKLIIKNGEIVHKI